MFYALSALDIALWDIAGKAAGVSVSRLLGGARTDLPCYASLVRFSDPELARAGVRQALDCGFRAVKIHETALPVIRAAREESGAEVELMVDANCAWTLNEARFKAAELEEARLKWLEEPVWPPENYDGLAQLRARSPVPIAAGENVSTLMDFGRIMAAAAVDFIQPQGPGLGLEPEADVLREYLNLNS